MPSEPVVLYSEIDSEGYEVRKIDEYADGHRDTASRVAQSGSTCLSNEPMPPLDAINAQAEFVGEQITFHEFEHLWTATQD